MVDGETTASGPISGTKPTAGFNYGQQSMCFKDSIKCRDLFQ